MINFLFLLLAHFLFVDSNLLQQMSCRKFFSEFPSCREVYVFFVSNVLM